jgi:hypothetical protein
LVSINKNIFNFSNFQTSMLTRESLGLVFNELGKYDRIVAVFTGLVPPYPIGDVDVGGIKSLILLIVLGRRDGWICTNAVYTGSLECLKYAHENGCPWDEDICRIAARGGYLECLEYAHTHDCPWDKRTCASAAFFGHLECLKYAHEHGCPWNELTCEFAAAVGSLACLKYAHEHGCPWDHWTCEWASNEACLEYAIAHGCPQ